MFLVIMVGFILVLVFFLLPLGVSINGFSLGSSAPVESGFSGLSEDISLFNNHFFIILVLFVLFDLEVVLSICVLCGGGTFIFSLLVFMFISLFLEWEFGKVQWGY